MQRGRRLNLQKKLTDHGPVLEMEIDPAATSTRAFFPSVVEVYKFSNDLFAVADEQDLNQLKTLLLFGTFPANHSKDAKGIHITGRFSFAWILVTRMVSDTSWLTYQIGCILWIYLKYNRRTNSSLTFFPEKLPWF